MAEYARKIKQRHCTKRRSRRSPDTAEAAVLEVVELLNTECRDDVTIIAVVMDIRLRWMLLLLAFCLLATSPAVAHAVLLQAIPAGDSTVSGPDIVVSLQFNSRVDGKRSRLYLVLPDGKPRRLEIQPQSKADRLEGRASGLAAGLFHIRWSALSADGHLTNGEYAFRVR